MLFGFEFAQRLSHSLLVLDLHKSFSHSFFFFFDKRVNLSFKIGKYIRRKVVLPCDRFGASQSSFSKRLSTTVTTS